MSHEEDRGKTKQRPPVRFSCIFVALVVISLLLLLSGENVSLETDFLRILVGVETTLPPSALKGKAMRPIEPICPGDAPIRAGEGAPPTGDTSGVLSSESRMRRRLGVRQLATGVDGVNGATTGDPLG